MRFFFVLSALFLLASATSLRDKRQCGCSAQPTCSCQQSTPQQYTCACQQQAPTSSCSCSQQTVQLHNAHLWQVPGAKMEMIVTRRGRSIFPILEYIISGMDHHSYYALELRMKRSQNLK
ncbi:unnamed protein product [Caenorhabditis bovis]|uniref:T-box domain-containing protein n=1 Tax=Caenorhabditis bovis TaxID=2654633 RepID=A0A8S1EEN6_9PELO|nr:unnamed protein product [Caenorhabditis bovis]